VKKVKKKVKGVVLIPFVKMKMKKEIKNEERR